MNEDGENITGTVNPAEKPAKKKKAWVKYVALALACALLGTAAGIAGVKSVEKKAEAEEKASVEETLPEESKKGLAGLIEKLLPGKDKDDPEEELPAEGEDPAEETEAAPAENPDGLIHGQREDSVIDPSTVDTNKLLTAAEVYALNVNSTVGITVGITTNYWGYTTTAAASGSGFIITADGYILTNYHVVEGAKTIQVATYDGESYDAELVGVDENNDVAVIKIDAQGLTPVILGDSDNMNVGDTVIAIGNPLGELTFSLTQGVVSALGREVTLEGGITMNLIQTDCAINSGNSGGALFNLHGEVIGITNAKYSSSSYGNSASIDNIGFAIPINSILTSVESILEKGYVSTPFIGVTVSNVDESYQGYGLPAGAAVAGLTEGGPADRAGIQENDIITAINGEEIADTTELKAAIAALEPGDVAEFTVYRQGETLTVSVTIGEKSQYAAAEQEEPAGTDGSEYGTGGFGGWGDFFGYGEGNGDGSEGYGDWGDMFGYGEDGGSDDYSDWGDLFGAWGDLFGFGSGDSGSGSSNNPFGGIFNFG